ncbi:MAG: hypothetical protein HYS26_03315 [Candidatus Kaiserbacteria bacterium]|nr:MAG: hypothetical protein HYS26_03315 [Candidatus Kaiserbacteria bacterium]
MDSEKKIRNIERVREKKEAVQAGTVPTLKHINAQNPVVPIPRLSPEHTFAEGDDPSDADRKLEANAIVVASLQSLWPRVEGIRRHYQRTRPLPEERLGGLHVLNALESEMYMQVSRAITSWCEERRLAVGVGSEQSSFDDRAYRRYNEILPKLRAVDMRTRLQSGIETACSVVWGTLQSIPKYFEERAHRDISPQEFEIIARNNAELVRTIAQMELSAFSHLSDQVAGERDRLRTHEEPWLRHLEIVGEGDAMRLELAEDTRRWLANSVGKPREIRTGCPALYARGARGKNIVMEMYEWATEKIRQDYYPYLEKKARKTEGSDAT